MVPSCKDIAVSRARHDYGEGEAPYELIRDLTTDWNVLSPPSHPRRLGLPDVFSPLHPVSSGAARDRHISIQACFVRAVPPRCCSDSCRQTPTWSIDFVHCPRFFGSWNLFLLFALRTWGDFIMVETARRVATDGYLLTIARACVLSCSPWSG